jgi:hypothetical protein
MTAKEIISNLSDIELHHTLKEIKAMESNQKEETNYLKNLASRFRNELNIVEVNTLTLTKDLIIREAAERWTALISKNDVK